ncbi:MAG: tetratricopeptide repeat protein [Betaproteobacteria bacterium]|nr:MAG: tetratricopeptide repeat protein [Betaproteobacteria bacterium]
MSLINRVLKDLDERGAEPSPDSQYSGEIRPVATQDSNKRRKAAGWLIAVCGAAVVALVLWSSGAAFKDFPARLWAGRDNSSPVATAAIPVRQPQPVEHVPARVEAALMVPVFQLSGELTMLPTSASRTPAASSNAKLAAVNKDRAKKAAVKKEPVNKEPVKPTAKTSTDKALNKLATTDHSAAPRKQQQAVKQTQNESATKQPAAKARPVAKEDGSKVAVVKEEPLEEIVIPVDLPASQIEKQARDLTSYERAEIAFRDGVASLRRGQLEEAESQFQLAIDEDRSHVAAQQALIGMLIDAGRLQDAEDVLNESLEVNPRQPTLAMVLARLQVERGDLETAVETLDRVSSYAGTDANFLSFMAAVLQRAQRHEQAVIQYRNALALMPRNPVWLMGLGISLRELGEREQAQQAFASAAAIGTLNPDLQAFVQQQQRELQKAIN